MRRTNKSANLLYLFQKTIIGMVLNRHESQALHKKITLFTSSRAIIQQSNWTDNSLQLVFTISFVTVVVRKSDSNRTICSFPLFTRLKLDMYIVKRSLGLFQTYFDLPKGKCKLDSDCLRVFITSLVSTTNVSK